MSTQKREVTVGEGGQGTHLQSLDLSIFVGKYFDWDSNYELRSGRR